MNLILSFYDKLQRLGSKLDWRLLLFLVLFLNVKSGVKIIAILLIYLLQPNFRFGFRHTNSRLPIFYLYIIGIAVFNWIISQSFLSLNNNLALLIGITMWTACILAVHQVKLCVDKTDTQTIYRTVVAFFILNALFSIGNYALIVWETGALNPYRYQGDYQKYFIRTGDYIKGITLDTSTTNAVINAFGVIFFLIKRNWAMLFLCMLIFLLTVSNILNIMMLAIFAFIFIYKSDTIQKSFITICLMAGTIFMVKVSPQNFTYVKENIERIVHAERAGNSASSEQKTGIAAETTSLRSERTQIARLYLDSLFLAKFKNTVGSKQSPRIDFTDEAKPAIITPNIYLPIFQSRKDVTSEQKYLIRFINANKESLPLSSNSNQQIFVPGKIVALSQTINYLKNHREKILTGSGTGTFSSKLAFRMTGLGLTGSYPSKFATINPAFLSNHLDIYFFYFSKNLGFHSLMHTPNSVYLQLLSEYGIIGLFLLGWFYFGYFTKHYKQLTYGIPLLILMAGILFIDYWYEQLSVIILFELLLMLDIKESSMLKQEQSV